MHITSTLRQTVQVASLASPSFQLLELLALVSGLCVLASAARRHPGWLLGAFGVVILLAPKSGPLSLGDVAGRNVLGYDPIAAIAVTSALFGLPQLRSRVRGLEIPLSALLLLISIQAVIGFVQFSTAALLSVRSPLVLAALSAFVVSLDADHDIAGLVRDWVYWTAGGLSLLALSRAMTTGIGNANLVTYLPTGEVITSRVATAEQIVLVAAAGIMSLFELSRRQSPVLALRTITFLIVVLIAQHRSVWVASLMAVIVLSVRSIEIQNLGRIVAGGAVIAGLVSPFIVFSDTSAAVNRAVRQSLSTVSATTGTGGARVNDSAQLILSTWAKGTGVVVFGSPYGTAYDRVEEGRLVTFSAHNAYVKKYLELGLVGVAMVLAVLGRLLSQAWRSRGDELGLMVLFIGFSLAYDFPIQFAPILGLIVVASQSKVGLSRPEIGSGASTKRVVHQGRLVRAEWQTSKKQQISFPPAESSFPDQPFYGPTGKSTILRDGDSSADVAWHQRLLLASRRRQRTL